MLGLFDRVVGYVATWSYVSARNCLSDMIIGLVPTRSDVSARPFDIGCQM